MVETIVRHPDGTARHEVGVREVTVPDIRGLAACYPDQAWADEMWRFYHALCRLLFAARVDGDYPQDFFVPDLWHPAHRYLKGDCDLILSAWTLGHDLAKSLGYRAAAFDRARLDGPAGLPGTYFVRE
jgi:hypothetical protein